MFDKVYLDWAATAPLCEESAEAMAPYLVPGLENLAVGGNANSLYSVGRKAFAALEGARESLAQDLHAGRPDEVVFTSGATEANNAALRGIVSACEKRARQQGRRGFVPHIVVSAIEHDAVLETARALKAQGCELTVLSPDKDGFIDPGSFADALQDNTVLASVQTANNEVGTVQAISELASLAHGAGVLFHTDGVQALGKAPFDLAGSGVDAASFSAHKVGGPKGVGALYLKAGTPFDACLTGGGQEGGKRSGTQNVCGAVGFAAACQAACGRQGEEARRLMGLRDRLYEGLAAFGCVSPSVAVPAGSLGFLPHIVNVCVKGFESETLILRLDRAGFAVSGGSACSSHSLDPSHVLSAIGIPREQAYGSLRMSLGLYTTQDDIDAFLEAFRSCINE